MSDVSSLGWIAVPGGMIESVQADVGTQDVAVLRVLIVPRLVEQLAGTPMEDWPSTINQAVPDVEVRQSAASAATPVPSTLRRSARTDVWRGFMAHGIQVTPWTPPEPYTTPAVTRTHALSRDVADTYRKAANKPGDAVIVRDELKKWQTSAAAPATPTGHPVFAKVDFHRAVSLLREHPSVLRMLGLIVELELRAADLPRSETTPHAQVRVTWPGAPIEVTSPWTAYQYDGIHFLPAPSGDIRSGLVDLSDDRSWEVITVDLDGGISKLTQAARAVLSDDRDGPEDQAATVTTALPSLKSAGLQVVRKDRENQLANRSARGRTSTTESLERKIFHADDLVLGYRIDVRPQDSDTWFSLHARMAKYTIDGVPLSPDPVIEEGHIKPYAAIMGRAGLHTDEIVARWDGWSLALPRPSFDGRQSIERPTDQAAQLIPYRFEMKHEVAAGTIPDLLFGVAYQLRARVVDIAGGGLALNDPLANAHPTSLVPYVRYEPLPPPELAVPEGLLVPDPARPQHLVVDPARLGPGGTLERLVVRSEPIEGVFSSAEFDGDPAYPPNDKRTFVAPPTTFQLAEQHGMLTDPGEQGFELAMRANASDPSTRLPDPAALGAAVTLMPEAAGLARAVTDTRPWAGAWPDHDPKQIHLIPGALGTEIALRWVPSGAAVAPVDDAESSTARVVLPPGERVIVELSSTILQGKLDSFAIKTLASAPEAETASIEGRHPMLTPPRRLELVHAVRRPISAPSGSLTSSRLANATYAILEPHNPILGIHTPSTAQLDIRAEWEEWSDAPKSEPRFAPLPSLAVSRGARSLPEIRHEFGDTKHRMVKYTVTAVSRFRDCFVSTDREDGFIAPTTLAAIPIKSSARPAPPVIASTVPAFAWSDAPRPGGGLVRTRSAGRLRVELGRPWFTTGAGEMLGVVLWPGTEEEMPAAVRSLVSWVNRDPIHPTASPKALADASIFRGAVDPVDVALVETGHEIRVLPYPVFFSDGRWYADIEMPGAVDSSYSPFVHLSLARFQRESLAGMTLSATLRADMVPLLPHRSLEVHTDANGVRVTLSGLSRQGARPNRVTASIERCNTPDIPGAPVDLVSLTRAAPEFPAWVRVDGATVTGKTNEPLPALAPPPAGGERLRLVVREMEDIDENPDGVVDAARELSARTVYVDVVPLPIA